MRVEVVYALAQVQEVVVLELADGSVATQAVAASGLQERYGLAMANLRLAIFGKAVPAGQRLRDGDRVELLRPLAADPKEARRSRARKLRRRQPFA